MITSLSDTVCYHESEQSVCVDLHVSNVMLLAHQHGSVHIAAEMIKLNTSNRPTPDIALFPPLYFYFSPSEVK